MKNFKLLFVPILFLLSTYVLAGSQFNKTEQIQGMRELQEKAEAEFKLYDDICVIENKGNRPNPNKLSLKICDRAQFYDPLPGRVLLKCEHNGASICLDASDERKFFDKRQ